MYLLIDTFVEVVAFIYQIAIAQCSHFLSNRAIFSKKGTNYMKYDKLGKNLQNDIKEVPTKGNPLLA